MSNEMKTLTCAGTVRGPKRGRIYVYDARPCTRKVRVATGVNIAYCPNHR